MKHLKYFKNKNKITVSISSRSKLFEILGDKYVIELVKEEVLAIKEILIDKSYNTYICDTLEIYLYDNILTIKLLESDVYMNIEQNDFEYLLKNINKYYNRIRNYEYYTDEEYENSNYSKTIVHDSVRTAEKYNL